MTGWEYKVLEDNGVNEDHDNYGRYSTRCVYWEETLNKLGAEGWEIIAVRLVPEGVASAVLKRELGR